MLDCKTIYWLVGLTWVCFSCEGECMRSFHATEEAGEDSACESLGLTSAQVEVYSPLSFI